MDIMLLQKVMTIDHDGKELQEKSQQNTKQMEEESYSVPDNEPKASQNNKQVLTIISKISTLEGYLIVIYTTPQSSTVSAADFDNEDTVTISLIISEDEHGQKRTQVIIPTTDNLKCDICNKSFKTSFQLLRHNRLKHAREEDITTRNFPCDLCPKRCSLFLFANTILFAVLYNSEDYQFVSVVRVSGIQTRIL